MIQYTADQTAQHGVTLTKTKKHFIQNEDYFVRNSYEAQKELGITAPNGLILITESGYLMLAKSFTDDLAWDVQRQLVKSYFRAKEISSDPSTHCPYVYVNKTFRGRPVLTVYDISNIYNIKTTTLYNHLRKKLSADRDYKLIQGKELSEYNSENSELPYCRKSVFVVFNTGMAKLVSYYRLDGSKIPLFMTEDKGYVVDCHVRTLMEYVRREIKGVEALTYLLESEDSPHNLENYRKTLARKLSAINWWKTDVAHVRLGVQQIAAPQLQAIHSGEYGIR